jgi:signal transduction histidine kinase
MDNKIIRHELKTPIGIIRGYLSMLKDGDFGPLTLNDEQAQIFAKIDKDLTDLIEKINTLFKDNS